jgi:hypothetical protein
MAKRVKKHDDYDSPWKDALHHYLESFLAFFFADIHADIDWSRGYEALDKEFQQIIREAKVGKHLADKLFKVWLQNGQERWLLIHVEVQGDREETFAERMFNYNSAVRKLYNQTVVSLAVLCDDDSAWRPTTFEYGCWGCTMQLTFRIAKLLDFHHAAAALDASVNPFETIVAAHLQTMATRTDANDRKTQKLRIVKSLLKSSLTRDDIRRLFLLIDWMMALPYDLEDAFRNDVHRFEEENKMEYISSIERIGHKKGLAEGIAIGHQEGHQEGLQEGERSGLLRAMEISLKAKFGVPGTRLMKKAKGLRALQELVEFTELIQRAESLREVRAFFD